MPDSAPFLAFAQTLADVADTSGRNDKADRLGVFLSDLSDDDLRHAARWAAGRVFPLSDQRTVSVGFASLRKATAAATGADPDQLQASLVTLGDPGDVAAAALDALVPPIEPTWTLAVADDFFADIAATRGSTAKTEKIADALAAVTPVEARFLVKLLAGETRIGMLEGGVESAIARLYEKKLDAVKRANRLVGDVGETAVLARHDRLEEARLHLFHPIKFMLATAAEASDDRTLAQDVGRQIEPPVAVEDKFDGIRAQVHVARDPGDPDLHGVAVGDARVALFSRTLDAIQRAFPDLAGPLAAWAEASPTGVIVDGEIVPLDPDAVADGDLAAAAIVPFQSLQKRLGRKTASDKLQAEVPVAFVAYDVLAWDDQPTFDLSYRERQALLGRLPFGGALRRSDVTEVADLDRLDELFDAARMRGNEGLMVKGFDSLYKPGRRGRDWLKVKKALATLDVVVTSVERGHGGRRRFLSDFTFAVQNADGELLNVGKAYSGLTDAELTKLTAWFEEHTVETFAHGKARTVEPEVVIEVAFDNAQVSTRHKSGYALRFPRIVRWRHDKPVDEIDTVETVAALAGGGAKDPDVPSFDERLADARQTFRAWLDAVPDAGRVVVFCHFDADGLGAGAVFGRALKRLGYDVEVVSSGRDETAFSDSARERLAALQPEALIVTDLGVNRGGTLEDAVPVLYVDHHRPSGEPGGAFVVSGYGWDPIPCSAWLAYDLVADVLGVVATDGVAKDDGVADEDGGDGAADLLWVAAVGVISDLGEKAPWPLMADAKKRYTAKWLKETVALVNAARRAPSFDAATALDALMTFDDPKALATAETPSADRLRDARAVVKAETAEARKAAPVFSVRDVEGGAAPAGLRFALVRIDSAAQVHPLIAQQWRGRLPDYPVICANTGYLDGVVAFSTRAKSKAVKLPEIYQSIDTPGWNGTWGHGHDQASGGHLPPDVFNDVLDALGFEPDAHVPT